MIHTQSFNPHSFKIHLYKIKMSLYIYNVMNFHPYPMWDVTNISHGTVLIVVTCNQ